MTIEKYTKAINNPKTNEIGWYTRISRIEELGPLNDLAFDSYFRYKKHDGGLVFFVRNGYTKTDEWVPFTVEDHPKPLIDFEQKFSTTDYIEILKLVSHNQDLIKQHANHEIDSPDLIFGIRDRMVEPLNESPNLLSKYTGLPNEIWVDQAGTYKRGGHWMRLKVKKRNNKKLATYTIPEHDWIHDDGMHSWEKNMIEKYVDYNEEDLIKLFADKITYKDYLEHMIQVNDRGEAVNPQAKQVWGLYRDAGYGYSIVINNYNGKFNYRNKNGDIMIENGLFDKCSDIVGINGKLWCNATLGNVSYNYEIRNHKFVLNDKYQIENN